MTRTPGPLAAAMPRPWNGRSLLLPALGAVMVLSGFVSLAVGAMPIAPGTVLRLLLGLGDDPMARLTVIELRLPRTILTLAIGAGLGLAGAALQALFRNRLADPGLIGVSSGAALGAVGAIVLGDLVVAGTWAADRRLVPLAAFTTGMATTAIVWLLSARRDGTPVGTVLLTGIAINAFASAGVGLLISAADDRQLRDFTFWSLGSLAAAGWQAVPMVGACMAAGAALLLRLGRPLDAMLLGEREAGHLGVRTGAVKLQVIAGAALLMGAAVAVAGVIGFVGLVAPHIVRLAAGSPANRIVLPGAALLGGALLTLADCAARVVVAPAELPVGILTALAGAPVFLGLLLTRRRHAT